jgi:hypothetical protein
MTDVVRFVSIKQKITAIFGMSDEVWMRHAKLSVFAVSYRLRNHCRRYVSSRIMLSERRLTDVY